MMALFGSTKAKVARADGANEAEVGDDDVMSSDDDEDEADEDQPEPDEWEVFDLSRDWREDGPFDIDEVDLEADDVTRLDLGALIVTPDRGFNIQLAADARTGAVTQLVVGNGPQSAMQVTLLAAPTDVDYRAEIRGELVGQSAGARSVELAQGPFGTEIRRVVPVTDPTGREGVLPLRDWLVAGPRWVLNARLMGAAALDQKGKSLAAGLEEFFRNIVVRRDEAAMVPGSPIALTPPAQKQAQE